MRIRLFGEPTLDQVGRVHIYRNSRSSKLRGVICGRGAFHDWEAERNTWTRSALRVRLRNGSSDDTWAPTNITMGHGRTTDSVIDQRSDLMGGMVPVVGPQMQPGWIGYAACRIEWHHRRVVGDGSRAPASRRPRHREHLTAPRRSTPTAETAGATGAVDPHRDSIVRSASTDRGRRRPFTE